ncbi:MAG: peptidase M15, partial [Eubacterium callanderi]
MKTIRKRTVLLILAALTAAGILYFARELNWAPARQNPPPAQTEAPKPPEPPPEATPPEPPEPPGQPESGALEKQPIM